MSYDKDDKASGSADGLSIERGGERFVIEKSKDNFAVKKRLGAIPGSLDTAQEHSSHFPELSFRKAHSSRDLEVYHIKAESLDDAMDILRERGSDVSWCTHVYHMPGDPTGLMIPTDSIYIETVPNAEPEAINALLETHKLELVSVDEDDPTALIVRLTAASTQNPIKIANVLSAHPQIKLAESDFSVQVALKAHRPTDTLFPQQWHLDNPGGIGLTAGADVSAPEAWEITRGDRSIVVCIMDDGVDTDHDDFSSASKIVAPRDFGQDDNDPFPVRNGRGRFGDNHGTACAGVAVADENGRGVVGLAPGCGLMPIRTSSMISSDSIEQLFDYARINGADVISCSWGVNAEFFTLSSRMHRAIRKAATQGRGGKGCVILFAAGNEDSPVDGFKNGVRVRSGFAIHPDVMAIAASTSHDVRSHYSNFGEEIWVAAPSSGAGGKGITTTDRSGFHGYEEGDFTLDDPFGGTSSSTPLVAGLCGLMLSINPNLTANEVRDILKETADKIDQANGGYKPNGHSEMYGWGRINAQRAVEEARQRAQSPIPVRRVSFERTPGLAIPDNHLPGVSDAIAVDDAATVVSVEVSLDIRHTFRGDLQVELIGPDGTRVALHRQTGGTRDNLIRTYTMDDTPALSSLTGRMAQGQWSLHVQDLAPADLGTLDRWTLTLGLAGGPRTEWQTAPGTVIPDDDPQGIVSELEVDGTGVLTDIALSVDITHTYRGDLHVRLETPGGVSATVHQRSGGRLDNLKRTYRAADTPSLRALVDSGMDIGGTWKLHVVDHAPVDLGKLNSWKLKLLT